MIPYVSSRGFLPEHDPVPLDFAPSPPRGLFGLIAPPSYRKDFADVEGIGRNIPSLLNERRVRECLASMPVYDFVLDQKADRYYGNKITLAQAERLKLLYSYFASAYVWATHESPANRIPRSVAKPLVKLSAMVGRPPILSYADYCLNNWYRLDPTKEVALGNIAIGQHFLGGRDEDWFILVHVDIEARAALAIRSIYEIYESKMSDPYFVTTKLADIVKSLEQVNATMLRMPEQCSPDVYFKDVRPYIFGFENILYEGCFDNKPQSYRGETGAQSSIVPVLVAGLGIKHVDSKLTVHLEDMKNYMPPDHRNFIELIAKKEAELSLRMYVQGSALREMKDLYNTSVRELGKFRLKHLEYAVDYIHKKVPNPKGTGGTPFIPWLKQLKDETEAHFV